MTNVFLGQITMFGGNYNPRGFAFCNGQTLPTAQNQALFSLLGTTYGGTPNVTLDATTIPAHTHILNATNTAATTPTIANNLLPAKPTAGSPPQFYAAPPQGGTL